AGRTSAGARAASSHTGALAGNDRIYGDVCRQSGVIRASSLRELLDFARAIPVLPTPKGNNVVIITGAGGSGVLLSDACVDNGLSLMAMPPDLDAAFRKFIPPFGAAGNPVDITGGEPPTTYQNTVRLGLEDARIHALVLGYWHTIITPPMVFARLMAQVVEEMRAKGFVKPVVASLAGDVEVEEAAEFLYQHGIPAYAYSTEITGAAEETTIAKSRRRIIMTFQKTSVALAVSLALGCVGNAHADQASDMQAKLDALQKEIQELQAQIGALRKKQEQAAPAAAA